jgi:hypothetical protein
MAFELANGTFMVLDLVEVEEEVSLDQRVDLSRVHERSLLFYERIPVDSIAFHKKRNVSKRRFKNINYK